jgi:hypothetical protein
MPRVPLYISALAFATSMIAGLFLFGAWMTLGGSHDFALASANYGAGMVYVGLCWAWDGAYGRGE